MSPAITAAQIPAIAERLPPFPRVVPELLDSLQSDTLSVDNLVRIARNDSVIAAAILSGANGLRRLRAQPDTADLFAAASLIGTNKLKQIIVKLGLNKLLSEGSGQAFFYEHSLAVAIVAQELAREAGRWCGHHAEAARRGSGRTLEGGKGFQGGIEFGAQGLRLGDDLCELHLGGVAQLVLRHGLSRVVIQGG